MLCGPVTVLYSRNYLRIVTIAVSLELHQSQSIVPARLPERACYITHISTPVCAGCVKLPPLLVAAMFQLQPYGPAIVAPPTMAPLSSHEIPRSQSPFFPRQDTSLTHRLQHGSKGSLIPVKAEASGRLLCKSPHLSP